MIAEIGEADAVTTEAPGDDVVDGLAAEFLTEDDDERRFGGDGFGKVGFARCELGGKDVVPVGQIE
jgi:hypothetical protein